MGNRSRLRPGRGQYAGGGRRRRNAGSLEEESLSMRHAAASGITQDGLVERAGLEAEMAITPGWRGGRVLRWWSILALVGFVVCLVPLVLSIWR